MGDVVKFKAVDKDKDKDKDKDEKSTTETFEDVIERNRKNQERLKQERNKNNKGVLRSYRIKD